VVSWASLKAEQEGNYHTCRWEEEPAYHIGHSLETPELDSHEDMQLGPQNRSSQSETRNGEVVVEVHAFCNRLYHPYEPGAEDNRDSLEGERRVF
jgi:hypothetical protein